MRIFLILCLFILASCDETKEEKPPKLVLSQTSFSELPNWGVDAFESFIPAFSRSCMRILKQPADKQFGTLEQAGTYGDWHKICNKFNNSPKNLKIFFEENFIPYLVSDDNDSVGLFTGYYEASLRGSRTKKPPYIYPLHSRPDDLVMVQLGDFREHLKGERIAGRVVNGSLKPYETRSDIVSGNWKHNDKVLLWVDSAVDAFFVQIQGSGVVHIDNGSLVRIGYDGQNGHPYYAIGRKLVEMGELTKEKVSMQSIRLWLENNPDQANKIMNSNKSYVFFREIMEEGSLGAEGVVLTAKRSLAIDNSFIPYGVPLWVDIEHPLEGKSNIRHLMIAQDTGGAIRGVVRGDMFWGYGKNAEDMAGKMKSSGKYWILLPKPPY